MRAARCFDCLLVVTLVACRPPFRSSSESPAQGGHGGGGGQSATGGSATGGSSASGGTGETAGSSGNGGTNGDGGSFSGAGGSGGTMASGGSWGGSAAGASGAGGRGGNGGVTCTSLPSRFSWTTGSSLVDPVSDSASHDLVAIKEPSLVSSGGHYHLYATVVDKAGGANMTYSRFLDFGSAGRATVYYMDYTSGFSGTRSSPQLLYVTGQKKWYLLNQASGPAYATASDPSQVATWTKPSAIFSSTPAVVTQNAGSGGPGWSDFWVICDSTSCHLFFANQNNTLFRSQTSLGSFPNGFGTPTIVMQAPSSNSLFAVSGVYKVAGMGKYLLLVEAVGNKGRFIRSWTSTSLDGSWTALADTEDNPFAGASNVTFTGNAWTRDIAQGELVRSGSDETATIQPCGMQFMFAGRDPYSSASPALLPWKLGLLTSSN